MSSRTVSRALWIVPSVSWLGLGMTAWWLTPLTPILVGAFAVAIVALVTWLSLRGTPSRSTSAVQRVLLVTQVIIAGVSILAALAPILGARPTLIAACLAVPIALVAAVLATQKFEEPPSPSKEDAHWRYGLFYVNREDESVWVPKRSGLGYTLNFAHPIAWLVLGLILLFPVVIVGVQFLRR